MTYLLICIHISHLYTMPYLREELYGKVYLLEFGDGSVYVGSTSQRFEIRFMTHQYKKDTTSYKILWESEECSRTELLQKEQHYISQYPNNRNKRRAYINPEKMHKIYELKRSPNSIHCDQKKLEAKRKNRRDFYAKHAGEFRTEAYKEMKRLGTANYRIRTKYGSAVETERPWVMLMPFFGSVNIA